MKNLSTIKKEEWNEQAQRLIKFYNDDSKFKIGSLNRYLYYTFLFLEDNKIDKIIAIRALEVCLEYKQFLVNDFKDVVLTLINGQSFIDDEEVIFHNT